jgi:hypothetical protein
MVHKWNLVVQIFSKLLAIPWLENLMQSLYGYFSMSPKKHI